MHLNSVKIIIIDLVIININNTIETIEKVNNKNTNIKIM
jgi:hypothetical protein